MIQDRKNILKFFIYGSANQLSHPYAKPWNKINNRENMQKLRAVCTTDSEQCLMAKMLMENYVFAIPQSVREMCKDFEV